MLGFSSLVWPFSKFGMGIEKKKIVLARLSPELSVAIQRLSHRCEHLSHGEEKGEGEGCVLYSACIDIRALVVIPP